jgi:hypothetical protein
MTVTLRSLLAVAGVAALVVWPTASGARSTDDECGTR